MKTLRWTLLALVFLTGSWGSVHAQANQTPEIEIVSISTNPYWIIRYDWDLRHSAQPEAWELWRGDRGRSLFTIEVARSDGQESAWVQGEVCIINRGNRTVEGASVRVTLLQAGMAISSGEPQGGTLSLAPDETVCTRYRLEVPRAQLAAGGEYSVSAQITDERPPRARGVEGSASFRMPDAAQGVNEQVQVTAPGGGSWSLSGSQIIQYEQTFSCDAAQGAQSRTATITETGQSARADVSVTCHALEVWPVVRTYYNRVYHWQLDLQAAQPNLSLLPGETSQAVYQVSLNNTGFTDMFFRASGSLFVRNPAPFPAVIESVEALLSRGASLAVDCGRLTFPHVLESGKMIRCQYSGAPREGERVTAAAVLSNTNYHHQMEPMVGRSTRFDSGAVIASYLTPRTVYETDACVRVRSSSGASQRVCRDGSSGAITYAYSVRVGPFDQCGSFTVEEDVGIISTRAAAGGSARLRLQVTVPCSAGCTQPPGYWMAQAGFVRGQYDETWKHVEGRRFFKSERTWVAVMHTQSTSNAYYTLARQYIAAKLNLLKGVSAPPEVVSALEQTEKLYETYAPYQVARAKVSLQREIQSLAQTLDHFNRGLTGPGMCSRQP